LIGQGNTDWQDDSNDGINTQSDMGII